MSEWEQSHYPQPGSKEDKVDKLMKRIKNARYNSKELEEAAKELYKLTHKHVAY